MNLPLMKNKKTIARFTGEVKPLPGITADMDLEPIGRKISKIGTRRLSL